MSGFNLLDLLVDNHSSL